MKSVKGWEIVFWYTLLIFGFFYVSKSREYRIGVWGFYIYIVSPYRRIQLNIAIGECVYIQGIPTPGDGRYKRI